MDVALVRHYLRRATDFLAGMQTLEDLNPPTYSAALLAIHSAVSYCDALRVALGNTELSSDDHANAVSQLDRLLPNRFTDRAGLTQLKELLAKKTQVAYGRGRLGDQDLKLIGNRAERFSRWANNAAREMKLEGWRHDEA